MKAAAEQYPRRHDSNHLGRPWAASGTPRRASTCLPWKNAVPVDAGVALGTRARRCGAMLSDSAATTFMEALAERCGVRKASRLDYGVPNTGTLKAFMEVLAERCGVQRTSRLDYRVSNTGTLRAASCR